MANGNERATSAFIPSAVRAAERGAAALVSRFADPVRSIGARTLGFVDHLASTRMLSFEAAPQSNGDGSSFVYAVPWYESPLRHTRAARQTSPAAGVPGRVVTPTRASSSIALPSGDARAQLDGFPASQLSAQGSQESTAQVAASPLSANVDVRELALVTAGVKDSRSTGATSPAANSGSAPVAMSRSQIAAAISQTESSATSSAPSAMPASAASGSTSTPSALAPAPGGPTQPSSQLAPSSQHVIAAAPASATSNAGSAVAGSSASSGPVATAGSAASNIDVLAALSADQAPRTDVRSLPSVVAEGDVRAAQVVASLATTTTSASLPAALRTYEERAVVPAASVGGVLSRGFAHAAWVDSRIQRAMSGQSDSGPSFTGPLGLPTSANSPLAREASAAARASTVDSLTAQSEVSSSMPRGVARGAALAPSQVLVEVAPGAARVGSVIASNSPAVAPPAAKVQASAVVSTSGSETSSLVSSSASSASPALGSFEIEQLVGRMEAAVATSPASSAGISAPVVPAAFAPVAPTSPQDRSAATIGQTPPASALVTGVDPLVGSTSTAAAATAARETRGAASTASREALAIGGLVGAVGSSAQLAAAAASQQSSVALPFLRFSPGLDSLLIARAALTAGSPPSVSQVSARASDERAPLEMNGTGSQRFLDQLGTWRTERDTQVLPVRFGAIPEMVQITAPSAARPVSASSTGSAGSTIFRSTSSAAVGTAAVSNSASTPTSGSPLASSLPRSLTAGTHPSSTSRAATRSGEQVASQQGASSASSITANIRTPSLPAAPAEAMLFRPGSIGARSEQLAGLLGLRAAGVSIDFVEPHQLPWIAEARALVERTLVAGANPASGNGAGGFVPLASAATGSSAGRPSGAAQQGTTSVGATSGAGVVSSSAAAQAFGTPASLSAPALIPVVSSGGSAPPAQGVWSASSAASPAPGGGVAQGAAHATSNAATGSSAPAVFSTTGGGGASPALRAAFAGMQQAERAFGDAWALLSLFPNSSPSALPHFDWQPVFTAFAPAAIGDTGVAGGATGRIPSPAASGLGGVLLRSAASGGATASGTISYGTGFAGAPGAAPMGAAPSSASPGGAWSGSPAVAISPRAEMSMPMIRGFGASTNAAGATNGTSGRVVLPDGRQPRGGFLWSRASEFADGIKEWTPPVNVAAASGGAEAVASGQPAWGGITPVTTLPVLQAFGEAPSWSSASVGSMGSLLSNQGVNSARSIAAHGGIAAVAASRALGLPSVLVAGPGARESRGSSSGPSASERAVSQAASSAHELVASGGEVELGGRGDAAAPFLRMLIENGGAPIAAATASSSSSSSVSRPSSGSSSSSSSSSSSPSSSSASTAESTARMIEALRSHQRGFSSDDRITLGDLTLVAVASATQQLAASPAGGSGGASGSSAHSASSSSPAEKSDKSFESERAEIEAMARSVVDEIRHMVAVARERSGEAWES